jgi:hypothetical protein
MKTHYILCAAILFPQLALALPSGNQPTGNAQATSCGTVQATLDYCARINPAGAARYQEQARRIAGTQFKDTGEYKGGYASAQAALRRISEHEGRESCVDFLEPARTNSGSHESDDKSEKHDDRHDGRSESGHDEHDHDRNDRKH